MRVRDLMTPESKLVTVHRNATAGDAVKLLMEHEVGALPVVDGDRLPLGIVAERDLVRALQATGGGVLDLPVERVMRRPPPTCDVNDQVVDVMSRMTRERSRHLLVCEDGRIGGVVSVGDLVKHRLAQLETEAGVLRDYVAGQRASV